ncbi:hypothetical protein IWZ03DRAFT_441898 [Phyllosticta citriasiana]|uniref:BTB domain-containing protein n=1 Tax=Phyllosticta citriasiana TaxID=595635 RepID=A0ABR1KN33_9PEZI
MAEENVFGPLKAGLRGMLESGLYADLQVLCNDGSYFNVHRMVLCSQSAVFMNAVQTRNSSTDPYRSQIKIENDDPAAVKALIEYLYRFEYNVCAIGESYDVKGLRDLAKDRVKTVFENATSLKELRMHLAVKAIYDLDVASDSGLRHLVVELCREKIHDLLEIGKFCEAMDEVKGLGHDLVRALINTPPPTTQLAPFGGASTPGLFANWPALPTPPATQTNTRNAAANATTSLAVPRSIFGISSPYIELNYAAKECSCFEAIEFKEPYMSFSREEIRLADYSTPVKSLFNLKTSCVPESSSSFLGTDISTVSKPLVNDRDNFVEGFASVWTLSTVTQGQSSQTPRVTFNNSTPVPSPRGLSTNNPNSGGLGSGPTSSKNTQT